jgi:hypothetical protein
MKKAMTLEEYRRLDAAGKIKMQPMRVRNIGGPVAIGIMAMDLRRFENKK